ncbi:MAG: hypothetical protein RSA14_05905, partial [Raoultibacter sp.]
ISGCVHTSFLWAISYSKNKDNCDSYTEGTHFDLRVPKASCTIRAMSKREKIRVEDDEREQLAQSFNSRISTVCKFGALIISVVTFVTTILNQSNTYFVVLGLSLAVALLALALLEDSRGKKG